MAGKNGDAGELEGDDEEAQWAKASPRLKAIITEALDDYSKRAAADKEEDGEDTDEDADDDGGTVAGTGKRPGRSAAAAAAGGRSPKPPSAKHARQARPSGGSFFELLTGR